MFLRRLQLTNVKALRKLDLPFIDTGLDEQPRQWTLLLGDNGSGKSTVLRALALLFAGSDAMAELLGRPDHWVSQKEEVATLEAEFETQQGEPRQARLELRRGDTLRDVFARNGESLAQLDDAIAHSTRNYFLAAYGAFRPLPGDFAAVARGELYDHPRAQSVGSLFAAGAPLIPLSTWARDLDYRRGEAGLEAVQEAVKGLLPDAEFERIDRDTGDLLFRTREGVVLPLTSLSDGHQALTGWLGDLLARVTRVFEDYKKPLSARGLLIIDEIDLHLHPLWRRHLIGYLSDKLPNMQVLATTNSAVTAHQAGEGELWVLRRESPSEPPHLNMFPGTPRTLLLHQLLLSPAIGLSTLDSPQVEGMKDEFRELRDTRAAERSETDEARLNDLRAALQDMPDWPTSAQVGNERRELLEEIRSALKTGGS